MIEKISCILGFMSTIGLFLLSIEILIFTIKNYNIFKIVHGEKFANTELIIAIWCTTFSILLIFIYIFFFIVTI